MYCCLWRSSRISRENSVNTSKVLRFVGRFSFHLLYRSGADARKCCTIHFQYFAIVHAYVLINPFSESKFEMSADFWQRIFIVAMCKLHYYTIFVSEGL